MKVKNKSLLHIANDEHECQFECSQGASLGFVYDALCQMRAYVFQRMQDEAEKEKCNEKKECCKEKNCESDEGIQA